MKPRPFVLALLLSLTGRLPGAERFPVEVLDRSLQPIAINDAPGAEYGDAQRNFAMAGGIEVTREGRVWVSWVAGGDNDRAYLVAATSDNRGVKPLLQFVGRFPSGRKDPRGKARGI